MGIFRSTGRGLKWAFKPAVDMPSWLGYRQIAALSSRFTRGVKPTFVPLKPVESSETYDEAVVRLKLSEEELALQQKSLLRLTIFYLLAGLAILIYGIFLFWGGGFSSGCLAIALTVLAFANAFRHHFWYFQMKHRKLGCSIKEWWNSDVKESASET